MSRSVYIFENADIKIGTDGPAILIERPGKSPQRIPFNLISRVYLIGNITLNSRLIIALAENNITLIATKLNGEKRAMVMPFNDRLPKFHKLQRMILEDNDRLSKYINWVETYRHYFQLMILRKYYGYLSRVNSIGEGDYKHYIMRLMPEDKNILQIVNQPIGSLLTGLINERLVKAKLDVHIGGYFRRVNFGCLLDLLYILEAFLDEQTIMFFRQRDHSKYFKTDNGGITINEQGYLNIVNRFENKRQQIESQIDRVIDDYFALLREFSS